MRSQLFEGAEFVNCRRAVQGLWEAGTPVEDDPS